MTSETILERVQRWLREDRDADYYGGPRCNPTHLNRTEMEAIATTLSRLENKEPVWPPRADKEAQDSFDLSDAMAMIASYITPYAKAAKLPLDTPYDIANAVKHREAAKQGTAATSEGPTAEQQRQWVTDILLASMVLFCVKQPMQADISKGLQAALAWALAEQTSRTSKGDLKNG